MRTSEEMMDLILKIAKGDERIRAVTIAGSRVNRDCPADKYQDFDITYYVNDVAPFWDTDGWIEDVFGKPLLMQKPESMELVPPDGDGKYVYLMLFPDGNRIDLCFSAEKLPSEREPMQLLLDKDGTFPQIHLKENYWYVNEPTQKVYSDCCNEFHWCMNNVAKGIARDELSYAMEMLNHYVRKMLIMMLGWYVGSEHDFQISIGKMGKYLKKYLTDDMYDRWKATYPCADSEEMWKAAFEMLYLFGDTARSVADRLNLAYDETEEQGIESYMSCVRDDLL